jgi:hypothetical protein
MIPNCFFSVKAQNYYWGNTVSSSGFDGPGDVHIDTNGDIINVGVFNGVADIQAGTSVMNLVSNGDQDIFIIKYNSNGGIMWAKSLGQSDADYVSGVTTDANGNIFVVGSFVNTIDLNPDVPVNNFTAAGSQDAFLLKLDSNGNYLWAKIFGSTSYESPTSVALSPTGEIVIGGIYSGVTDMDPGPGSFILNADGWDDSFILKLDASGNFIWAKGFLGSGFDMLREIGIDASGNIYGGGDFDELLDLDPGAAVFNVNSVGSSDIFFLKLDPNGDFVWGRVIGNSNVNQLISIQVDPSGNLYAGGYFFSSLDFDPGPGAFVLPDGNYWGGFLMKLDSNGDFLWANNITSTSFADVRGIAINSSGSVYLAGRFEGTADFIPGAGTFNLTSINADDIYTAAYDASGNFLWANAAGGQGTQYAEQIAVDDNGFTYSIGFLNGTADLNPQSGINTFVSAGDVDEFIVKLGPCLTPPSLGTINAPSSFCVGQTAIFSVNQQSGVLGYTWSIPPGSSIVSGQNTNSIQIVLGAQSGNVQVYANGNCGNGPVSSFSLNINSLPTVTVTAAPAANVCAGQSITLNGQGASSYSFSNGVTNGTPFIPTSSGNYVITGMDLNGCTDSETIYITVNQLPNVAAVANPSGIICLGDIVTLNGTGALSYSWDNGVSNGVAFVPPSTQGYVVTGTDANGCSQTSSITVNVNADVSIVVQPVNDTAEVSTNAIFVVENAGSNASFQWQQNMGTGFMNLSNFGAYSGVNNDTLIVSNVNLGMNNYGFRCIVSSGNCADTSDFGQLIVTNLTSLETTANQTGIQLFPNPSAFEINVLVGFNEVGKEFIMHDVEGRIVYRKQIDQVSLSLSIAELADGIYWVNVAGSNSYLKFVKMSSMK